MDRKRLLYLISADPRVSPFDINMAYDAGFDAVIPYAAVEPAAVPSLVQDIMFSRGPKGARASSIFFSGADLSTAEAMLDAARRTHFPPFQIGLMIDPRGGYTTAAALWTRVVRLAAARGLPAAASLDVIVAAGTGGVGKAAAGMAARDGARVRLTSRGRGAAEAAARAVNASFGVEVGALAAASEVDLAAASAEADVILATGAAGVRLLSGALVAGLRGPKILADVNAVPPSGIEGLKPQDDGVEIAPGLFGIGAMAVGDLKNKVEIACLRELLEAERAPLIDSAAVRRKADEILAAR